MTVRALLRINRNKFLESCYLCSGGILPGRGEGRERRTAGLQPQLASPAPTSPPQTLWSGSPRLTRPLPRLQCCSCKVAAASSESPVCEDPSSSIHRRRTRGSARSHPHPAGTACDSTAPRDTPPWDASPRCHCRNLQSPVRRT